MNMKRKPYYFLSIITALCLMCASCGNRSLPVWDIYAEEWHFFRGTEENIAVTHADTPKTAEGTLLKWAFNIGSRPAGLLYADGFIITFADDTLYKINAETGICSLSVKLCGSSKHSSVSPAYRDGILYTALDGGIIQALDFETLDTVWVYNNRLGGQALSPVLCTGEYICTGFWNGETESAEFVCLDTSGHEVILYQNKGGFYFAGAVEADGYIVVPSDNGEPQSGMSAESLVVSLDPVNGSICDSFPISGDGRSSAVYLDGRIYAVSKCGVLYSAAINNGKFSDFKTVELGGESTAPPVIYGNYAFIGTSAKNVLMIDLDSMEITASVSIEAYPQAAMLLSDAYAEQSGCVYIYAACNALPGGITVIKADIFKEKMTAAVLFNAEGYEQFCLSAPICSIDGALYYANDSGYIFSLVKK